METVELATRRISEKDFDFTNPGHCERASAAIRACSDLVQWAHVNSPRTKKEGEGPLAQAIVSACDAIYGPDRFWAITKEQYVR